LAAAARIVCSCAVGGISRRQLLAGATAGAVVVAGCGHRKLAAAPTLDARDWASVKAAYPLDPRLRHFAGFLLAAHPAPVRAAIDRHRGALDRDPVGYLMRYEQELDAAVTGAAARHLGARAQEIALTDSTTMGLALVYRGLLRPGDEVLTTEHDHYATHEALRLSGARVRRVRLYDDPERADAGEMVARLERALTRRTRLVAVTWVHSSSGVKLPIPEIARALRGRALLAVDGVHGLGAESARVQELGCDVLAAGCHKWLGGPRGTGIVWAGEAWQGVTPLIPTFDGRAYVAWMTSEERAVPAGPLHTPGGFHSFEHRWALADAFALQAEIGQDRIAARVHELAGRLRAGLAEIRGVRLRTPADAAGIVCCELDGVRPGEAVRQLRDEHRVIASVTPYATEYVRFGTGLMVDEDDVDAAVAAVRALT
jgi:selenocysteine lyase/cysteine desulfurase